MHSSIEDNWIRLQMMHNIARQLYNSTKNSPYRDPANGVGLPFTFCAQTSTVIQQEAAIVGMVKVWAFVTLECIANHAIANVFSNRMAASIAIESPKTIVRPFGGTQLRSELATKIAILNDELGTTYDDRREEKRQHEKAGLTLTEELKLAEELSQIRNSIVHDKPFELNTSPDGEVEIKYYGTRLRESERVRYSDLIKFFLDCDKLREHILNKAGGRFDGLDRSFSAMLND